MTSSTAVSPVNNLTVWSRYLLLVCAFLFVAGALGQFFLAGLSVFDSPLHWADHENLGHTLGLLGRIIWLPAAVGRVGWKLIVGSLALAVLFEAHYAFVEIDEPYVQALHPLNGVVLFALAFCIGLSSFDLVRHASH